MSIYKRVNEIIKGNKIIRDGGGFTCIPWDLPRLSTALPGIQRAKLIGVTANSKVGKTQLADFLFLHQPYEFYLKYPTTNIKPRIFYFSLEMSKESKVMSVLSYKLFKEYGISKSPEDLLSVFKDRIVDDELMQLIDSYEDFFKEFEQRVTFIDNIRNPYGIFKYMETYAHENGYWTYKEIDWKEEDGSIVKRKVKDFYTPNDKEELPIVIVDHISLLTPEKQQSLHQAMSDFSSNRCLYMRDKFKYCIVLVQQQSAEQEKQQFSMLKGESIVDKLKPSADGLGDNKLVGRDLNLLLGLFAPHRYNLKNKQYEGYDLSILKDNYRELSVILNRDGRSNLAVDLFFDGASNFFQELPKPEEMNEMLKVYEYVTKKK